MDNKTSGSPFYALFIISFFFIELSSAVLVCKPASCNDMGPQIRFPFRLKSQQKERCGYPGFELSCNDKSQTIITLPGSGDFRVTRIDYSAQAIYINDPKYCLPQRIINFNVSGSPFIGAPGKSYTFYNCSSSDSMGYLSNRVLTLPCLHNKNYTVLATEFPLRNQELPPSCQRIRNVSVPLEMSLAHYWASTVLSEDIELIWNEPKCRACEVQRLYCGFNSDSGLGVGCSTPPRRDGLPRGAKYGVLIGVGIPGLVCLIGMCCYLCSRMRNLGLRNASRNRPVISASTLNPTAAITGLDGTTIESYPKTVLGDSRRLPKISDSTCPICLCEYQSKETLRSIPDCNHYFHVGCIDEWLKLNGTCPVCRNTPEGMTGTTCSSVSSAASSPTIV